MDNGAKVLLTSHLGRPKGEDKAEDKKKFSLQPTVGRLSECLGKPVKLIDDCIGPKVEEAVKAMKNGEVSKVPKGKTLLLTSPSPYSSF